MNSTGLSNNKKRKICFLCTLFVKIKKFFVALKCWVPSAENYHGLHPVMHEQKPKFSVTPLVHNTSARSTAWCLAQAETQIGYNKQNGINCQHTVHDPLLYFHLYNGTKYTWKFSTRSSTIA